MSGRWMAAIVLAGATMVPVGRAHEGHVHTYRGTVSAVSEQQIEVKTTDGKSLVFLRDAKTVHQRGKTKVDATSVAVGERVVVGALAPAAGKSMTAQTVQLPVIAARR